MPTTIRTSDPRELLALVPFQLGFQPVESAVRRHWLVFVPT